MNAHTFPLPTSPVKGEAYPGSAQVGPGNAQVASREWHAVTEAFMGRREPVIVAGRPLTYRSAGLAAAAALGYPDGKPLWMGWSAVEPTAEQIREVANPVFETAPPVFDIDTGIGGTGAPDYPRTSWEARNVLR